METLERIITEVAAYYILVGAMFLCYQQCVGFLESQNLDRYFLDNGYYEFYDNNVLVKHDVVLCGKIYRMGDVIDKSTYDYCINK